MGSQCCPNECLFRVWETPGGRDFGQGARWAGEGNAGVSLRATQRRGGRILSQLGGFQVSGEGSKGIIMYIRFQSPANIRFSRQPTFVSVASQHSFQLPANIRGERSAPALQLSSSPPSPIPHPPAWGPRQYGAGGIPGPTPPLPPPRGRGDTARQCRPGYNTLPPPSRLPPWGRGLVELAWQYAAVHLAPSSRPLACCPHLGRRSQGYELHPARGPLYHSCRYHRHLPALRCSRCTSTLLSQKSRGIRGSMPHVPLHRYGHGTRTPTQTSPAPAPASSRKASFLLNKYSNRADYSYADVAPALSRFSNIPAQDHLPDSTTACKENVEASL